MYPHRLTIEPKDLQIEEPYFYHFFIKHRRWDGEAWWMESPYLLADSEISHGLVSMSDNTVKYHRSSIH